MMGVLNRVAQASALVRWIWTIEVPAVHQPFPLATIT